MRDLQFWQEKYKAVARRINDLDVKVRENESGLKYSYKYKLKSMYGCRLNNNYYGYKMYNRRKKWLRNRLKKLTIAGKHRREIKRLEATKLAFYEKQIIRLGGKVPKSWW